MVLLNVTVGYIADRILRDISLNSTVKDLVDQVFSLVYF